MSYGKFQYKFGNKISNSRARIIATKFLAAFLIFTFVFPTVVAAQTTSSNSSQQAGGISEVTPKTPTSGQVPGVAPTQPTFPSLEFGVDVKNTDTPTPAQPSTPRSKKQQPQDGEASKTQPTPGKATEVDGEDVLGPAADDDATRMVDTDTRNARQLPQTDLSTGALSYTYDLMLPSGRNGMTPSVGLTYSSNKSDSDSFIGYGWEFNIPYISRVNRHGSDQIYNYNDFTSSLSGELSQVSTSTAYIARVDDGENLKYTFENNAWVVYDKQGTRYSFGTDASARQDDPNNSSRVYKWMLQEVRDPNDNFISYEYYKNAGQIYPDVIQYTNYASSTNGIFKVIFNHDVPHQMSPTLYHPDFAVKSNYRLSTIEIKENNQWIKKYDFFYDNSFAHKLFIGIQETGRDLDSGTTVIKDRTDFTYQSISPMTWTRTSGSDWELPYHIINHDSRKPTLIQIHDVNGDSYPDVLYRKRHVNGGAQTCPGDMATWINDTHGGWNMDCSKWIVTRDISNYGQYQFHDNGLRFFDYNGDQLTDFIYSYSATATSVPVGGAAYRNTLNPTNDSTWPLTEFTSQPPFIFGDEKHADNGTSISEINGDGLPDVLYGRYTSNTTGIYEKGVYVGNGATWASTTSWNLPYVFLDENGGNPSVFTFAQLADINSDGLNDFLYRSENNTIGRKAGINNGHDWNFNSSFNVPFYTQKTSTGSTGRSDAGVRMADINGDSLVDFLMSGSGSSIYLNNLQDDSYFTEVFGTNLPLSFAQSNGESTDTNLVDINADGMVDFVNANIDEGVFDPQTHLSNQSPFGDMLTGIHSSSGATTTIGYKMSSRYFDDNDDLMNPNLPIVVKTVNTIATGDGLGNIATTTYAYGEGSYYFANPYDRKFAGFGLVTETDPVGNVTKTYFHQGNASATSTGEYADHISKMGKPYRVEQYDSNEDLFAKTINKWDRADLGNGASFVKLASSVEFAYDGDSDHKEKAVGFVYDDARGNLLQKTEYGEVSGSNDGSFTDTGSDKFITSVVYASSTPSLSHRTYLPSQETTVDQASAKVREKKTYYDTLPHGYITKGNPTKEEQWVSGSMYIDTEKTYNSYGLVTEEKDPRDKATTYSYDSYNLYPATTTNPLNQKTVFQYDYSAGKPKQVTDPNGYVFQTVFDGLDRVIEEKQPDIASPMTLVTKVTYAYTDTGSLPRHIHKTDHLSAATSTDSYAYVDGLGRVVQERTEAEDANTFVVTDTKYNSIGKVEKKSLPYFGTGSSRTTATTTNSLYVQYEYDGLGRVASIENSLGETVNEYDDWKLTTTDPNGEVKHLHKDAYENLVRVDEINVGNTYTTTYEYDGNKNLKKITDALGNIRNFTYDGVGRRLSAEDLHASADSTFGMWYYAYDAAGNLASSTDPKSQNVTYSYDDFNRPTAENYLGSAGTEIAYGYDTCVGGIGRLCVATSSAAVISHEYNSLGGVKKETKKISGATYNTSYTYDRLGNVLSITHPDNSILSYSHNNAGKTETVSWKEEAQGVPTTLVTDLDYGPTGQVLYQKNANGTETTNTFDPTKLYRLTNKLTNGVAPTTTVTTRFYAGSGDGYISYSGASTWGTAQLATTGTSVSTTSSVVAMGAALEDAVQTNHYGISRGFYPFNTSAIPSNAVITDATLNLYVSPSILSNTDNDGDDFLSVIQTSQASSSVLTTADYDNISGTEGSNRVDFGTLTGSTYQTFTLNSTGKSWIKKSGGTSQCGSVTGWTCLGTREGHDIINSPISTNTNNTALSNSSEATGTSTDPYLEVTYQIPGGPVVFQNISYVYDAVGNVTTLTEAATTSAQRTVAYQYDDLHRLTRASSTNATNNYLETYEYNAIGNLTNKSDQGSYTYAGSSGSNYANPHAATTIGSAGLTYDKNGNVLTFGPQANAWDYKNYITQTGNGVSTSTATYDHAGERVKYVTNSATTTTYVSKFYETEGSVIKRHVYIGDTLAVTIEAEPNVGVGEGPAGFLEGDGQNLGAGSLYVYTPHYVHGDHLSGSNVVTDINGAIEQVLDYYPYGGTRVNTQTSGFDESKKFASMERDEDTGLDYAKARYYQSTRGQFLSQDPSFLDIGKGKEFEQKYERTLQQHLTNPQALNSYSWALNNPIIHKDPEGEIVPLLIGAWALTELALSAYDIYSTANTLVDPNASLGEKLTSGGLTIAGFALPLGGYGKADDAVRGAKAIQGVAKQANWGKAYTLVQHTIDHAADFGLARTDFAGYANAVDSFIKNADVGFKQGASNFDSFVGTGDNAGKTYFFDKKTSTFGVRNLDGTNATAYKPKGGNPQKALNYWNNKKKLGG